MKIFKSMQGLACKVLFASLLRCDAASILWATADPSAVVLKDGIEHPVDKFTNAAGHNVNAIRFESSYNGTQTVLMMVEPSENWEFDCMELEPVTGAMYMSVVLGESPPMDTIVCMVLGYVDWDAYDAGYDDDNPMTWEIPFESLAYVSETVQYLADNRYVYETFDLGPPGTDWKPLLFSAIPEPRIANLFLTGCIILFLANRRKR